MKLTLEVAEQIALQVYQKNDCHYYGVALKVIYGMHLLIT